MARLAPRSLLAVTALALAPGAGCGEDAPAPDLAVEARGPHPVGTRRAVRDDAARGRALTVQVWYPAAAGAAEADVPIAELEAEPARTTYADLLAQADAGCPTRTARVAVDAAPAAGSFPLVAYSHCHECTRLSGLAVAERLASHGFVVVAVDHAGNTLWDRLDGQALPLDASTLALREADLCFALAETRAASELGVGGIVDPERTGVVGHSFGAVTAGLHAQRAGAAVDAAFALAAPMENPLLPGVTITSLAIPLGFLVAREDNSISELGNELIRGNFARATGPAWKLEVADAGHWSVSDLVGLVPAFAAGCGAGTRQTDGQAFTYLDAATGRGLTAAHVTAFFKATLEGDAGAGAYLTAGRPAPVVSAEQR
ncbi:MAG: hypothetical protein HS111_01105 [Kofleriaceae bacterium]|nr:hypothetical protein [Kofleriaceae bacterium]